jgi:DNA repair exonuclease SbcCD ATPase subunit
MKALGIVFSIFNLLLAGVVLMLAGMDYGRYRGQALSAFLHEVVITGLPVDENEVVESYPTDPTVTKLEPEVLKMVYANGNGGPDLGGDLEKTVQGEMKRVQGKVKANIDGIPNIDQKRKKLWDYLQFQARSIGERTDYYKMCFEGPVDKALDELNRRFVYVSQPQNRSERAGNKEYRHAAALVLVNLSTDPAWRQRVATVVGLDAYVAAVSTQADTFAQIANDLKELITADQAGFEVAYENSIRELMYQSHELYEANKQLTELKGIEADRAREVQQRQSEVDDYKTKLNKKTAETNAEIARLEAVQRDLFAIQQRLAQAQQQNDKLEAELENRARSRP